MIQVLRDPTYRSLFTAQVMALVGTGLLTVALGLLAFDLAGGAAGSVMGTALTIKMVAYVGVSPIVAALVDRLPKKRVLVGADLIRLAIAIALPFVSEISQIYVLVFILQSASATFTPAFQSLIPSVLPDTRDYTRALALSRLAYDLEALLSPIIAGALLTVTSYNSLFAGTSVGFAASAALILATRLPRQEADTASSTFWQRLPDGVRVFTHTPTLRFLALSNIVVATGTAIVLVNSVVYVKAVLALDDSALALTLGAYGVGSLVVALTIPRLVRRRGVIRTMMVGTAVIVTGLITASMVTAWGTGLAAGLWMILGTWATLGAGTALVTTPSAILLAEASTPSNRNLVYTAQFALSHACFLITYPLAGWLGAVSLTAAAVALSSVGAAATIAALTRRAAREFDVAPSVGDPPG